MTESTLYPGAAKMKPAVSVVVPLYKRPQFIGAAIAGILNQTFTDWECVLVDDGSESPELAEMCRRYEKRDARIKYIYQKNGGLSAARNRGAAESSAEFISFLDDDDIMHPRKLEKEINFLRENPEFASVRSYAVHINEKGEVTERPYAKDLSETPLIMEANPPKSAFLVNWNTIRADCFRAVGGFDPDFRLSEDVEFTLRISEKYPCALLREELLYYRIHGDGNLCTHPLIGFYNACAHIATYCRRNNIPEPPGERPFNMFTGLKDMPPGYTFFAYKRMRSVIRLAMRWRRYAELADMLRRFNAAFASFPKYRRRMYAITILWAVYYGRFAALPIVAKRGKE